MYFEDFFLSVCNFICISTNTFIQLWSLQRAVVASEWGLKETEGYFEDLWIVLNAVCLIDHCIE